MRTTKINLAIGLGFWLVAVLACSASTANLSGLKVGKDKDVGQETSTFGPNDTIYAVGTVSNAPGKVKVKGRLEFEDVPGQTAGPIPNLEKTLDLPGSGTATYSFTPTGDGWPKGKYKIVVIMMNEAGEQKDQKTASITIS